MNREMDNGLAAECSIRGPGEVQDNKLVCTRDESCTRAPSPRKRSRAIVAGVPVLPRAESPDSSSHMRQVASPKRSVNNVVFALNIFLVLFAVVYNLMIFVRPTTEFKSYNDNVTTADSSNKSRTSGSAMETPEAPKSGAVDGDVEFCSGHGFYESDYQSGVGACRCHGCFIGEDCSTIDSSGCVLDLYQGDPTMFEKFWMENGDSCKTVILGWQRMSYYANSKQFFFVQTELDQAIRSVHKVVGNAVTDGRHIVVGVGSTQLLQAAMFALSSSPSRSTPMSVVSAAPFYSAYPAIADYLRSQLYKWGGDAATFKPREGETEDYLELVTTPNNPTGEVRYPLVNGTSGGGGALVYDLAYYWPHYTPITAPADSKIMLFTVSKSTGHAGTRIGWAIVEDAEVAEKMAKFIELNTIGVSKDAQIRATHILRAVASTYGSHVPAVGIDSGDLPNSLFHFGASEMAYRWTRLRTALKGGFQFTLPDFEQAPCTFFGEIRTSTPAFAWLRCTREEDCEMFLKENGILTRSGLYFGADARFVRLSMVDRRCSFDVLVDRLEKLEQLAAGLISSS